MLFRGELQKYAKNSNFEHFESALYSKSVCMPLNNNNMLKSKHPTKKTLELSSLNYICMGLSMNNSIQGVFRGMKGASTPWGSRRRRRRKKKKKKEIKTLGSTC